MNVFWLQQVEADVRAENDWLSADEMLRLGGMRFPKRRADWRLGRWTAKCAIAACLGRATESRFLREIEIRSAPSGAPEVFLGGHPATIAVSLSHRAGKAMAAIVESGIALGCDLEFIEPRGEAFLADYFTAEEQLLLSGTPRPHRAALVTLLWSAKESALKAVREGLRVDTRSLRVRIVNDGGLATHHSQIPEPAAPARLGVVPGCGADGWHTLEVCYLPDNRTLHGYWQRAGDFVRTVVAAQSLPPPVGLRICRLTVRMG